MRRPMQSVITALVLLGMAAPAVAQTVEEPSSKVPFPVAIEAPGGGTQVLTGTAIRTKTFLKVKVYAFGIYVDQAAAKTALSAFAGKEAKELEKDDGFYGTLLQMRIPMSLRLVMTRNVGGEDMVDAFDGALRPRVQQAAAERNMTGGDAALEAFRAYFVAGPAADDPDAVEWIEMTDRSELLFSCTPDGTLYSRVKGEDKPPITSPALCWALFDVYLGDKPISGGGKKSVIARVPELLGAGM